MKFSFPKHSELWRKSIGNCLKFRQSSIAVITLFFLALSCGKIVNQKQDTSAFKRNISFLMMETQCNTNVATDSPISKEIASLYSGLRESSPQSFFFINPRYYNFDNPLVISMQGLEESYQSFKNDPQLNFKGEDLYYLYNSSRRYEDQKCSFDFLATKKKNDIRPYLNIAHYCYKKYQTETCYDSEYTNMGPDQEKITRENTLNLCESFSKDVNCQAEYNIVKKNKTIGSMISRYYQRFQNERFEALFKLRPIHQKYSCQNNAEKTVMNIKVLDSSFNHDWLVELLSFVEQTWSEKNFELKLDLVKTYSAGVVTLLPTNRGISYVPDANNRIVYLSTANDRETTKRVLAHEFGHVLGFPDCYIEFFDESKKELVYYEISQKNTNIMCSLKAGVRVPDDYFTQLAQNSCLFN